MTRHARGAFAKQLQPQLTANAMRACNRGERNPTLAALAHGQAWVSSAAPSAGCSLDSPLPALASAGCGDSVLGGGTSSAPSAGSALDSPSLVASGWSAAASSDAASSAGAASSAARDSSAAASATGGV